jgi:S-layer homology domain
MSLTRSSLPRSLRLFVLAILCLPAVSVSAEERIPHHGRWLTPQEIAALPAALAVQIGPTYGTLNQSNYTVGSCEATNRNSADGLTIIDCGKVQPLLPGPGDVTLGFPVHLPTGALIEAITMNYYDSHTTSNPSVGFYRSDFEGVLTQVIDMDVPDFSGGNNSMDFVAVTPHQVDNTNASYQVLAILDAASGTEYEGIYNFTIHYRLQVSPAPGSATFADVPTSHPFFRYVEALVAAGITGGCGGGLYCVDAPLTRGQMAVFLSVALGLHFPN